MDLGEDQQIMLANQTTLDLVSPLVGCDDTYNGRVFSALFGGAHLKWGRFSKFAGISYTIHFLSLANDETIHNPPIMYRGILG